MAVFQGAAGARAAEWISLFVGVDENASPLATPDPEPRVLYVETY